MDELPVVFDVRIETPSGDAHEYVCDPDSREVRLRRTVRSAGRYPADWAVLPGSLTPRGEPLGVLVVTDVPCSRGALARVRLIGMATIGDDRYLLAVLVDDERVAKVATWRQVGARETAAIESVLCPGPAEPTTRLQWSGPAEAARAARDARLAARMARAEFHATRGRQAAWRAEGAQAFKDERIYTRDELGMGKLPARFQEYVARLLVGEERILAFVPRPAQDRRVVWPLGRRRRHEEGLLVVTDQQALWMTDVCAAPMDVIGYGFIAESVPLERLSAVELSTDQGEARLRIDARSAQGVESSIASVYPRASFGLLREAVGVLDGYLSNPTRTALMRVARPDDDDTRLADLVEAGDARTARAVEEWQRVFPMLLEPSERVVVKAVIAGWGAADGQPRLWLVTDTRVVEVCAGPGADGARRSWRAEEICAVRVTYSVFESSLEFQWSNGGRMTAERVVSPLVSAAPFVRVFVAVRRIMVGRRGFGTSEGSAAGFAS